MKIQVAVPELRLLAVERKTKLERKQELELRTKVLPHLDLD